MEKAWLKTYPTYMLEVHPDLGFSSLVGMYERAVKKYTNLVAFESSGVPMTYGQVWQHATHLASYLQHHLKCEKGDRIALMSANGLAFPITVIAAHICGLTVVNVNPLYTPRELEHQLNDAQVKTIVIAMPVVATLEALKETISVENVVAIGIEDLLKSTPEAPNLPDDLANPMWFMTALELGQNKAYVPIDVGRDDLAFLQYTGGTTGPSKGAMLSQGNMLHNLSQSANWWQSTLDEEDELMVTVLPLYHIFGLLANFLTFFNIGGTNILIPNPRDMDGFMAALKGKSITAINGVNTIFAGLPHVEAFRALDFSRLDHCIGGGTPIIQTVADQWKDLTGSTICQAYGLSEASPILTSNIIDSPDFKPSVGLPVPGTDIILLDENEQMVAKGEAGELCARGPQIMQGYWQREEATAEAMTKDGFLKTGDIAIMDDDGYFYIVDRKKDMVLVSGFNVYPNEIEAVVTAHPDILEMACIGVPDEKSGEAVKAFIILNEGCTENRESIINFCRENLTAYKVPKHVDFVTELPKSTVGKILRRELRVQELAKLDAGT